MKKKINTQKSTCNVLFSLPKEAMESSSSVVVLGDFSEWNAIPLELQADGSYEVEIEIPTGRDYHFRYLIDGNHWENDWAADSYEISPRFDHIYNSVVSLTDFLVVEEKPKADSSKKIVTKKAEPTKKAVVSKKTTEKDDLTKIEGIGPKIAGLLNADGIETFAQLAKSAESTLQGILDKGGKRYQIHNPSTWAAQANLAAKGEWVALKKWQDELNGGKV